MEYKNRIEKELYATLAELQQGNPSKGMRSILQYRLETLVKLLNEEDIPEEYWEQIEKAMED